MGKQYEYKIEYSLDKESDNIIAVIPELNNVLSFGKTFAEAESNIKEAAECYLEALLKDKKDIPKSVFNTDGTYLKLFAPKAI